MANVQEFLSECQEPNTPLLMVAAPKITKMCMRLLEKQFQWQLEEYPIVLAYMGQLWL
jgi:hypothetical protein